MKQVTITVNGKEYTREVEPRLLLSDFLRHELGLTGTHVGCEHGVCGACTILFDGESARSCLTFAVQADGHEITTVEGLTSLSSPHLLEDGRTEGGNNLHPLQQAFWEAHGLQCGYCTPGILMSMIPFLKQNPNPTEDEIRHALSGNLCRCTGYQHIVDAVKLAAEKMR
ncbi:MAG: (2Fe-2S)-binding protein [Chloroflexi bacterium]|nr:(2Fe-2S)-binding protein [Chloroflexota bacterium]